MTITSALVIPEPAALRDVLTPLAAELDKCYWLINTRSGPFRDNLPGENEALYDELSLDIDACWETSSTCWCPGTLPRHAEQVVVDEWTYLFALQCDAQTVSERAAWLGSTLGNFDSAFFAGLPSMADLFAMHVDGWWEIYTHRGGWQRELCVAFPKAFLRSAREVGRPPIETA